MEHIENTASIPETGNRAGITRAPEGAADNPHRRTIRADGWTPERIRTFLYKLAETGVVAEAARAAGMSRQSAYALRRRAGGRSFDIGWRVALSCAQRAIDDAFRSRVLHGRVDVIVRDGKVWGERHRHDNRLTMAVLTRLDRFAELETQVEDECNTAQGASKQGGDDRAWQPSKSSTSVDSADAWQPSKSSTSPDSANEWQPSRSSTSMDAADAWQPSKSSTSMDSANEWQPSISSTSVDFGRPRVSRIIAASRRPPSPPGYARAPEGHIFVPSTRMGTAAGMRL